jgi:hypothetical protein
MKHAGPEALDQLEDVLAALRRHTALKEKSRGCFYRKSSSFLHFHEDPAGLFADVKLAGAEFDRLRVSTAKERAALLTRVAKALAASEPGAARPARSRGTRRGA